MKTIIYLSLAALLLVPAFAEVPVTCISDEKMGGEALLKFKVNNKVSYTAHDDKIWKLHLVGVTPYSGPRKTVYGSGSVSSERIGLSFVKDDFVLGRVNAQFNMKIGYYIGTANIDIVNNNEVLSVKCIQSDKTHLIEN